jgi:diguanylate cyclase (GGDEF)-like protein
MIAGSAALLGWLALGQVTPIDTKTWVAFGLIAVGAALAQLFPVVTPRDQSYHMTMVVLVPAALLLPTWLLPTVVVVQHLPEWLKVRYPWYIQTFNASNYLLDLFAAGAVGRYVLHLDGLISDDDVRFAIAGLAAAAALVLLNHTILAIMLSLGRGHSLRDSGLFSLENLSTEIVLAALGVLVAFAWTINPALIPFAVAPLLLVHRSLAVPLLEQEARLDPKTGLFNVRHFSSVLNEKLEYSLRMGEQLALLMIDLDLLREINNTYGHLAGDAVLERVADVFRSSLRADDVAARFGGEEFVVLLPDTDFADALALAERIRETIGRQKISVGEIGETLTATVSIGVAM